MGYALVGADRGAPDFPAPRVPGGPVQRVPADPDADRRAGDPLWVEAVEDLGEPVVLVADQLVTADPHIVEVQRELPLGQGGGNRQGLHGQARRVRRHQEQGQQPVTRPRVRAGARYDQDGAGAVHA
jgi:hypothetical protein